MSKIPEKYKNNCPLDHISFEDFTMCDCNYATNIECWYFQEQIIEKLQSENVELSKSHTRNLNELSDANYAMKKALLHRDFDDIIRHFKKYSKEPKERGNDY